MIYTINTQRLSLAGLQQIVARNDMSLIDVRAKPYSSRPEFNRNSLEAALGPLYRWHGDTLGGKGQTIDQRGLDAIAAIKNPLLMCMEEAPEHCHRHHTICGPHFPDAIHIFRDQLIVASDLQVAIDADTDEYETCGTLSDSKISMF